MCIRDRYISVVFGGRSSEINKGKKKGAVNHFHLVNSGTKFRERKSNGQRNGAVGMRRTRRKNMNSSFKKGFADRAIVPVLSGLSAFYAKSFERIFNKKGRGV